MMSSSDDKDKAELIAKMKRTKEQWDREALDSEDGPDETDALLSQAISMAIEQGRGWSSPEEREKYLEQLLDDDYIPPLFAENQEELEKSGLKDAVGGFLQSSFIHALSSELRTILLHHSLQRFTTKGKLQVKTCSISGRKATTPSRWGGKTLPRTCSTIEMQ
mmetsp:Transcript_30356/g.72224  ORF Transcript_30356/g.72224 Transcript_30356/m.72224 type:complete len:163 (-) Transcript_30356:989-1477(-)